jgi:hypothetical protein
MSEQVISSEQARLERGYRRILACYPRSFRRDNEGEILAVLLGQLGHLARLPPRSRGLDLAASKLR